LWFLSSVNKFYDGKGRRVLVTFELPFCDISRERQPTESELPLFFFLCLNCGNKNSAMCDDAMSSGITKGNSHRGDAMGNELSKGNGHRGDTMDRTRHESNQSSHELGNNDDGSHDEAMHKYAAEFEFVAPVDNPVINRTVLVVMVFSEPCFFLSFVSILHNMLRGKKRALIHINWACQKLTQQFRLKTIGWLMILSVRLLLLLSRYIIHCPVNHSVHHI
jgi:hypothetical protein